MKVSGLYCGVIPVSGEIQNKCVNTNGGINYHIKLDKPITLLGGIRKMVLLKEDELIDYKGEYNMTDLKAIEVTAKVTYTYTPREYLDYCEEYNVVPTQEGFEDFIADNYLDEEFTDKGLTITELLRVDYEKTY